MSDEIDKLAVGLAADHKAAKRKGSKALDVTGDGSGTALPPVEGDGAPELREAVANLGAAVTAADEADDTNVDKPNDTVAKIERMVEAADWNTSTLVGDMADTMLDLFKTRDRVWWQTLESDQREIVAAIRNAAQDIVGKAVRIIASAGDDGFYAKLEKYGEGGGLKISLAAEATEANVLACHRAHNQFVVVKRHDPASFSGTRRDPTITPDQPPLEFSDGDAGEQQQQGEPDPADADRDLVDAADGILKGDADGGDPFGGQGE
jgi:hypothetical protein